MIFARLWSNELLTNLIKSGRDGEKSKEEMCKKEKISQPRKIYEFPFFHSECFILACYFWIGNVYIWFF
jgi:hypothetical protein